MALAFISNTSAESIDNIEEQMYLMNCPLPIYDGIATLDSIDGYAVNYTVSYGNGTNNEGTRFICSIDSITDNFSASAEIIPYGETLFDFIPYGWLGYLSDTITQIFARLQAMFTLISFFVAPTNFNILGYTLEDITGIALAVVIGIYGVAYTFIGAMMYKILSPFSGVS